MLLLFFADVKLSIGLVGGKEGQMHSYCDEIILLVWKTDSPYLGKEGPAKLCSKGEQKRNVLVCPPVGKKIKYTVEPHRGVVFQYQKPVALYAELLARYTPHPCTVAEITGWLSHVNMGQVFLYCPC